MPPHNCILEKTLQPTKVAHDRAEPEGCRKAARSWVGRHLFGVRGKQEHTGGDPGIHIWLREGTCILMMPTSDTSEGRGKKKKKNHFDICQLVYVHGRVIRTKKSSPEENPSWAGAGQGEIIKRRNGFQLPRLSEAQLKSGMRLGARTRRQSHRKPGRGSQLRPTHGWTRCPPLSSHPGDWV